MSVGVVAAVVPSVARRFLKPTTVDRGEPTRAYSSAPIPTAAMWRLSRNGGGRQLVGKIRQVMVEMHRRANRSGVDAR
jgi:hypothetical protein